MFIFCALSAQPHKFLRIFDLSGKKIAKGYLSSTTDSSIKLVHDSTTTEYSATKIGFIKTKRSGGHSILIASAVGGVSLGLLALAVNSGDNSDSWFQFSSGEALFGGFIYGAAIGTITGGIISAANKRMTYQVNGDLKKWMEVKAAIEK
jgi:hypothetical protein